MRGAMIKNYSKTDKGYLRFRKDKNGKLRFEHCIVWEESNGPIPAGMQIHHKDFNKENNKIDNLQLVTPLEHKRFHSGCILKDGEWEKKCSICGEYKKCNKDNWYYSRGWINGKICKKCYIKKSLAVRKKLIKNGWKRKS
jgi:hypothetical protein